RHDPLIVERKAEGSSSLSTTPAGHPLDKGFDLFGPAWLEHRVGMKEQEPITARGGGASLELGAAAELRPDQPRACRVRNESGIVRGAAIDQKGFLYDAFDDRRHQRSERGPKGGFGVVGGDNH